ncbi:class I adenylate-forming enzyme family protein [candidate division CSSED10-310 bacterium]|uniref:Class I adenylate-forming enzyme family protein n=1 Tax=candidate division CSSED10-310 bacterium TaxID=2855610 RepID=A0ABV6YRR8_UNCC1
MKSALKLSFNYTYPTTMKISDQINEIFQHLSQPIYAYDGEVFTVADAQTTIEHLQAEVDSQAPFVALRTHSPFVLFCFMLLAWQNEQVPLFLDPALREEVKCLDDFKPVVPLYTDIPSKVEHKFQLISAQGAQNNSDFWPVFPAAEAYCLGFFTSGSEGDTKVVLKKTRQIISELEVLLELLPLDSGLKSLSFVPPYHIYGFLFGEMLPLLSGGTAYFATGKVILDMTQELKRVKPGMVVASPIHYQILLKELRQGVSIPPATYVSSGAPLAPSLIDEFRSMTDISILQIYGSTETGGIAYRSDDDIWQPLPQVDVRVKGPDTVIQVRSPWSNTACPDLWETTTDVGEMEAPGFRLIGRLGTLMKFRGKRLSSLEVENMLCLGPGVKEAAVTTADVLGEEQLIAFIVPVAGVVLNKSELQNFLQQRLAPYKVPRIIKIVASIPKRAMGKYDYKQLAKIVNQGNE